MDAARVFFHSDYIRYETSKKLPIDKWGSTYLVIVVLIIQYGNDYYFFQKSLIYSGTYAI